MLRLYSYTGALFTLVIFAELLLRANEQVMFDASHRILFKVALFERNDGIETVVLGSSRHADGFIPQRYGERSFNLATSGLSFELESYVLERLLPHRHQLETLIFELGDPLYYHEPLEWEKNASPLALWRLRSSLRHDSLARLLGVLFFGSRLDGGEITGAEHLAAVLGEREVPECDDSYTLPSAIAPAQGAMSPETARYATLLSQFAASGTRVLLVVPPLARDRPEGREREDSFIAQAAALAMVSGATLYSFADSAPKSHLRDTHHLNRVGAACYSEALARL